jgi:sigma-70-like protein
LDAASLSWASINSSAVRGHRGRTGHLPSPAKRLTVNPPATLTLLFCCCHPDLAPASQVALTLRAVGGLTTREIADAFYVPEATMAQRISRAKRALQGRRLDRPGDLAVVLRVLYLVYTAGHAGRVVDLAREAIRLARQLTLATEEPEASSRSTYRTAACGTPARSPRACASCTRRWPFSAPAVTRSRPPSPPCTTTRPAPEDTD